MMTDLTSDERAAKIAAVHKRMDTLLPFSTPREMAGMGCLRMIEAWREINVNWTAADVGFSDTPEELVKWEAAVLAAGEGILQLAEMIVEEFI